MKALPRTLVGFTMTDIDCYRRMQAWRVEERLGFDFWDSVAPGNTSTEIEAAMKHKFIERIEMSRLYVALIGTDANFKDSPIRWQVDIALAQERRILAVNLDGWRRLNPKTCPSVLKDVGATFVPYSPQIVAHALENTKREVKGSWEFADEIYVQLGYVLTGNRALRRASNLESGK